MNLFLKFFIISKLLYNLNFFIRISWIQLKLNFKILIKYFDFRYVKEKTRIFNHYKWFLQ